MEKKTQYKYLQLRNYFINLAHGGKIDNSLPSERELAALFGVSRVTVRTTLSAMVEEKYLIRCPRRGYFINPNGFTPESRRKKIVGMVIRSGHVAFYDDDPMRYTIEVCKACMKHNLLLQPLALSSSSVYLDLSCSNLDGLIWIYTDPEREVFEALSRNAKFPIVGIFDNQPPSCGNYVFLDHARESYQKTEYLIRHGCKRIAVTYINENVLRGYKQALADAGIPYDENGVFRGRGIKDLLEMYDKFHPDGAFDFAEFLAFEEMIRLRGLSVPDQFQYISGNTNECKGKTIFIKPQKEAVKIAVKHLVGLMNGKKGRLANSELDWELEAGNTTRKD